MINLPIINQITDTEDASWGPKSCGICTIKMLLVFKKPELMAVPVMDLLNEALRMDGYIENVGWKHKALVDLAAGHGVEMQYQKQFFNTPEKKEIGIKIIDRQLELGRPVIVTVYHDFDPKKGGHLVVLQGRITEGYLILDPYPGQRGNQYSVSRQEFLNGWRGGMIWLK